MRKYFTLKFMAISLLGISILKAADISRPITTPQPSAGKGRLLPSIPLNTAQLPAHLRSGTQQAPQTRQVPPASVTAVRLCDDKFGLLTSPLRAVTPQYLQDAKKSCVNLKLPPGSAIYPSEELMNTIYVKAVALRTRIQAVMKDFKNYPETLYDLVAHSFDIRGIQGQPFDFYKSMGNLGLDSEKISFYLDLCYQTYFREKFTNNPNLRSPDYNNRLIAIQERVNHINVLLGRLEKFTKTLDHELSQRNLLRLSTKTKDDSKQTGGGTASVETKDVKIQSLTPSIVKSLVQDYVVIFGTKDRNLHLETLTLSQLEEILSQEKVKLLQEKGAAELDLRIFSDPYLEKFWAKMELIHKHEALGFRPFDVLYRNTTNYSPAPLRFMSKVINKFKQPQESKEFSGVLLFKEGNPGTKNEPILDEIIVAFAGSNSFDDWKHNLDIYKQAGLIAHGLARNMSVHRGFLMSLKESLDEAGTKIYAWMQNYKLKRQGSPRKPILRITLTGHSLGGAIATLLGVYVKQNIAQALQDVAIIEVRVITFGAPPIFDQQSAKQADKLLGKNNVLRFWALGDPVVNLGGSLDALKRGEQTPLAILLGYYAIGTSIPLFDIDKVGEPLGSAKYWKNHTLNHYFNVLGADWQTIGNQKLSEIRDIMGAQKVFQAQNQLEQLEQLISFIEESPEWSNTIENLKLQDLKDLIQKAKLEPKTSLAPTVENIQSLQEQRYEQGKTDPLKFTKVDLSRESNTVSYHQSVPAQNLTITLDRSTSCKIDNLAKKFKFNTAMMRPKDQSEVSCACCIVKNTFVSFGGGTILHQAKDALRNKNIKTPVNIYSYCETEKHCADPQTKQKFFPPKQDMTVSFGRLMESLGLKNLWLSKKLSNDG